MRRFAALIAVGLLAIGQGGCSLFKSHATPTPSAPVPTPTHTPRAAKPPKPPIDPSVNFSKVQVGMTTSQVTKLIGAPTRTSTRRSWVPFSTKGRTTYYYKNLGRVVFAVDDYETQAGARVQQVEVDSTETGVAP